MFWRYTTASLFLRTTTTTTTPADGLYDNRAKRRTCTRELEVISAASTVFFSAGCAVHSQRSERVFVLRRISVCSRRPTATNPEKQRKLSTGRPDCRLRRHRPRGPTIASSGRDNTFWKTIEMMYKGVFDGIVVVGNDLRRHTNFC